MLSRRVRLDADVFLEAGQHTLLPGFTFNPWVGCEKVSPACKHCYAEAWSKRAGYSRDGRHGISIWGPVRTSARVQTSPENWKRPHRWNRLARDLGVRFKVFCASLSDVGEDHPLVAPWRRALFDLVDATPFLDWLLLTKRTDVLGAAWPWREAPSNVWVGATVEDQAHAEARVPELLEIPARVRFLSCEPLLEPLDLEAWIAQQSNCRRCGSFDGFHVLCPRCGEDSLISTWGDAQHARWESGERYENNGPLPCDDGPQVHWIIVGGESGGGHRSLDLGAVERLASQCAAASLPLFVKQDSGFHPGERGRLSEDLWSRKLWPEVTP